MLRILIADDHAIVRKGLREILREEPEPIAIAEASTGAEALEKAAAQVLDVVVLDISLPDLSGLEVLRILKLTQPLLPVLMLSMHSGYHYVMGSLKAGASGYLNKEMVPEELVSSIQTAISGGIYISHSLADELHPHL